MNQRSTQSGDESPHSKGAVRRRLLERADRMPVELLVKLDEFGSLLEHGAKTGWTVTQLINGINPVSATEPLTTVLAGEKDWPHAPLHRLSEHGTYMVTAGTLHKLPIFRQVDRLKLLHDALLTLSMKYGWNLEA